MTTDYLSQVRAENVSRRPTSPEQGSAYLQQVRAENANRGPKSPEQGSAYLQQVRASNATSHYVEGRDPAQVFRFFVQIESIIAAEFLECGGLTMDREVLEHVEGGVNNFTYKLPGRVKYSNITLKRGITYSRALWEWYCKGLYDCRVLRKNISIILGNPEGRIAKQWNVIGAYPIKWSGPTLNTETNQVASETLELAHHGLELSAEESHPLGPGFH